MFPEGNKPWDVLKGEWCQGETKLLLVPFSYLASSVIFLIHGNLPHQ